MTSLKILAFLLALSLSPLSIISDSATQSESANYEQVEPAEFEGEYIDLELIRYIGFQNFEDWLGQKPDGTKTVYELTKDFNITDEKVKELTAEHIYEAYMRYKPSLNSQSEPSQAPVPEQIEAPEPDNPFVPVLREHGLDAFVAGGEGESQPVNIALLEQWLENYRQNQPAKVAYR